MNKPIQEHEVDKMFPLRPGRLPLTGGTSGTGTMMIQNIIFMVRPKLDLMDTIADNIKRTEEIQARFRKEFHIFFVPQKTLLCEQKLKVSDHLWLYN